MPPVRNITIDAVWEKLRKAKVPMNLNKRFLAILILATLVLHLPSFAQIRRDEIISFTGVIEGIAGDFQSIIVNETRITIILPDTEIVDEKGNVLKVDNLRPKLRVRIEAVAKNKTFFSRKIVVQTSETDSSPPRQPKRGPKK
jgi:hypothetical protein